MWNIIEFDELPSTSTFAAELLARGEARDGDVIQAHHQTAGRGRAAGRVWNDEPGESLLMSAIVTNVPAPAHLLQYRAALAVLDALREVSRKVPSDFRLKWPNDILLNGKKICGILLEAQWNGSEMRSAIVGIGVNVHQRAFPPELSGSATSLILQSIDIEIPTVRDVILSSLESELKKSGNTGTVLSRIRKELAWMTEIPALIHVEPDGSEISNLRYESLDDNGALLLRAMDGVRISVRSGSIVWKC